jgi:tyrosine-specific transport protein
MGMYGGSIRVFTAALMITGTTVGIGILGLPVKTGVAGVVPSLIATFLVWAVMLATGWVIARGVMVEGGGVDYHSFVRRRLGLVGTAITVPAYLVLLYGIIAAHLGAGGQVVSSISGNALTPTAGIAVFFIFSTATALTGLRLVERINSVLMTGLFLVFMLIIITSLRGADPVRFLHRDWNFLVSTVPIIVCAQAYQIIIPSVCRTLDHEPGFVMRALVVGTLIPCVLNVLWILAVVGALPLVGQYSLLETLRAGEPATIPLAAVLQSPIMGTLSLAFSITVLFTSYVLQSTAIIGYFEDILPLKPGRSRWMWAVGLGFLPPLVVVFIYPALFLKALDIIGGISIILLFGIVPAIIMYRDNRAQGLPIVVPLVLLLLCVIFFSIEVAQETGLLRIAPDVEYWPVGK